MPLLGAGLLDLGKYHPPTLGLERACDSDLNRLVDLVPPPFDDDHRSVIEIPNTLIVALSRFDDPYLERFAWKILRSQRCGDLIQIDDLDIMKLSDLVEVKITREQLTIEVFGQQHEFHVDWLASKLWKLRVVHHEVDPFRGSDPVEDIQTASAPHPFKLVGTIGDRLEFHQNKSRHDQAVVEDIRFGKFRKPAVDDATGVEH